MRDKNCFECDDKARVDHHVVPKSLGGSKTVPLCLKCHGKIHRKDGKAMLSTELSFQAMQRMKKKGLRVGAIPYGKSLGKDNVLIKNENEQMVIRIVKRNKKIGKSYGEIMDILNNKGIKTRRGNSYSRSGVWAIVRKFPELLFLKANKAHYLQCLDCGKRIKRTGHNELCIKCKALASRQVILC